MVHDDASQYQVRLPKVQRFRRYHPEFWTIAVTLTFYTRIAYFQSMLWLMVLCHHPKFGCKKSLPPPPIMSSEDTKSVIFWLYKPHCDLDLEGSIPVLSTWHTDLGWCTTIPSLDSKGWAVQKRSCGQSPADRHMNRRTHGQSNSSIYISPWAFYMGYDKTWKRSKTKLYMFRKCYETRKKFAKCCESLANIRTLCW